MDFRLQHRFLLVTCIIFPVPHALECLKELPVDAHISSDATKVFNSEDSCIGETSDTAHPALLVCGALPSIGEIGRELNPSACRARARSCTPHCQRQGSSDFTFCKD